MTHFERVFISTGGSAKASAVEAAWSLFDSCSYGVELTAGQPLTDPSSEVLELAQERKILLHNYFPPPPEPLVLDLAEPDPSLYEESQNVIHQALALSGAAKAEYYAVHAGFLARTEASELGRRITRRAVLDRSLGLELMIGRLLELSKVAEANSVRLLVENHALSEANMDSFGQNFLLMVDPDEICEVIAALDGQVGLLLDVGHLNVSAKTLGFDRFAALKTLGHLAEGHHLSSNDGSADMHLALSNQDWFWSDLASDSAFYTVEIHTSDPREWIDSADLVSVWLRDPRRIFDMGSQ
ncbi:sugar phosphate isomerase/epimerase [bacterium]|nr:sugar phosphate isomerase/epimerase [bacterium]